MRNLIVWARLLNLAETVVQSAELEGQELVIRVRPHRRQRHRCGRCGQRSPRYDAGEGRRRWRALDLGTTRAYLEAAAPRVRCRRHGVVVARVPWADHDARFTRAFDEQVAWLAVHCAKSAVGELMRVSWRTVGRIVRRVVARISQGQDLLDGLHRIGIDEISYRRGQRYLLVVVDHDSGRLVWAAPGRDTKTLARFFDELGRERAQQLTHVSSDGANWIAEVLQARCPHAIHCLDPFHVVAWASTALDEVRRAVWNQARQQGRPAFADGLKGARWALWKRPQNLTATQRGQLAWIERTNRSLYRAYLLKEQLRLVFQLPLTEALALLESWLESALRSRLTPFVELAYSVADYIEPLLAVLEHRLSNARVEALNTRIRLIARRAFGFHSAAALIALAKLSLSGLCPPLPGRTA